MLTAAQAAADPDVVWLNQQASWLANAGTTTAKLAATAVAISNYILTNTPSDNIGLGYASTISGVYDSLYPSAQFPLRSGIMAGMANDLSNLLQGKLPTDVDYDVSWLSGQAAFYGTLPPIIDTLNNVAISLAEPAYSWAGATGLIANVVYASQALAALLQLGAAPSRLNAVGERMKSLATTLPIVTLPNAPGSGNGAQGGGSAVFGGSNGTMPVGSSGAASSSSSGLYVALAAAAASVGGWWYLRKKHLLGGKR